MKKTILAKTLIASAITFSIGTVAAAPYEIIDLGKIEGGTNSFAYGLNNTGEVVGFGDGPIVTNEDGFQRRDFFSHALYFGASGPIDLLTLENGTASQALSINDNGFAVGYSDQVTTEVDSDGMEVTSFEEYATLFNQGSLSILPGLSQLSRTRAYDINNEQFVIGAGLIDIDADDSQAAIQRGFVVNALTGESFAILDSLTPDSVTRRSNPLSINDLGDVVGWAEKDGEGTSFTVNAFITNVNTSDTLLELPSLNTPVTIARDINNNKIVVGFARNSNNSLRNVAFYYDSENDSTLTTLPYFDERFDNSSANAINDNGQIVGQALVSVPTTGVNTGFLFENNELKDLNDLIPCESGWRIDNATNINNGGEIIGYGIKTETIDEQSITEVRAFKLVPTGGAVEVCEEPEQRENGSGGSWSFISLLLLGLFGFRRKSKIK